ncbi:MAG: CpaE family protein [Paracoccaceae bacterium]
MPAAQQLDELKDLAEGLAAAEPSETDGLDAIRIPHINIEVFRETDEFEDVWARAAEDRRLVTVTTEIFDGGFPAAIKRYTQQRTPNLIIVETDSTDDILEIETDSLAEVCDADTQIIVVGHRNDIALYQKLLNMGVSNYIVFPVTIATIIEAISEVYREPGKEKIGQVTAVIGAKGGVGASTIAQNLALLSSNQANTEVMLVDMDLSFGTTSLNLDVEPNQGLSELIDQAERLDAAMLDRVLVKRGLHLSLLSTPPSLENDRTLDAFAIEKLLDIAGTHMPHTVLDIPHQWNEWTRRALVGADDVIVVATPELGCLRNATAMLTQLRAMRPNDARPHLVLNQANMPRRQEIPTRDIAQILKVEPLAQIPHDPKLFSLAASNARLVAEIGSRKPVGKALQQILTGLANTRLKPGQEKRKRALFQRLSRK